MTLSFYSLFFPVVGAISAPNFVKIRRIVNNLGKIRIQISASQYSTVVLTVVRVMIAKYRKSGIWGYRSSLTPEPVELK